MIGDQPSSSAPQQVENSISINASDCPIESVTVFRGGAEVSRRVEVEFGGEGVYNVRIGGLSGRVDTDRVNICDGKGKMALTDIIARRLTREEQEAFEKAEREEKQKNIDELQSRIDSLGVRIDAGEKTKAWLKAWAKSVSSAQTKRGAAAFSKESLEGFQRFSEFYGAQVASVSARLCGLREELARATEEMNDQRRGLAHGRRPPPVEAVASFSVPEAGRARFTLKYYISGASWKNSYDCRIGTDGSVELLYYGDIRNITGECWRDVKVRLSTTDPGSAGAPAELGTARVAFQEPPPPVRPMLRKKCAAPQARGVALFAAPAAAAPPPDLAAALCAPRMAVETASVSRAMTSACFDIGRRATVESDGNEHRVTIAVVTDLAGKLEYVLRPTATADASLRMRVTNTSEYQLLEGPCNMFVDGDFVVASTIPHTATGESFKVYIGVDRNIAVRFDEPFCKEDKGGFISRSSSKKFTARVTVENTKKAPIAIAISMPLPKARTTDVKVVCTPSMGGRITKRNMIRWDLEVKPKEKVVIPVEYTISYPKDRDISISGK